MINEDATQNENNVPNAIKHVIVVMSGKGGTGKTTVAVNLALSAIDNEKVCLADCDVEEPNDNLFLNLPVKKISDVCLMVPEINISKCDHCGKCSDFCRYSAIAILPKNHLIFEELCHGCGGCSIVCPKGAISEKPKKIGEMRRAEKGNLEFYEGVLDIGQPMAPPVIREIKRRLDAHKLTILDAAPGAACATMETLKGSNYCILVTEPTPFGLHDLKVAVQAVRKLGIPFGIVLNMDGIGNDAVEKYCTFEKIPVLLKIPYDRKIAELYSKGIPFIEKMPEFKKEFLRMLNFIRGSI